MEQPAVVTLDLRQLGTPWAILKVGQAIRGLGADQVLEVLGSDPALQRDLPQVVAASGGKLCSMQKESGLLRFRFAPAQGHCGREKKEQTQT